MTGSNKCIRKSFSVRWLHLIALVRNKNRPVIYRACPMSLLSLSNFVAKLLIRFRAAHRQGRRIWHLPWVELVEAHWYPSAVYQKRSNVDHRVSTGEDEEMPKNESSTHGFSRMIEGDLFLQIMNCRVWWKLKFEIRMLVVGGTND